MDRRVRVDSQADDQTKTYRPWRQKTSPQLDDPDVDGVKEWLDTSGMEQERKMKTRNGMRA